MDYMEKVKLIKEDSFQLATSSGELRNHTLKMIALALEEHKALIFQANQHDLTAGANLPGPIYKRLEFTQEKLDDLISGIYGLINLPDPLSHILLDRDLDQGLTLTKVSCPLGVIGVIFEARPDALVQITSLCIKSGNCIILKGGSEAKETNKVLFDIIYNASVSAGMPKNFALLVESRSGVEELLGYHQFIDLIIPRGSNEFVQHIMANSKIPVMGHADGICHVYVDRAADMNKALPIIIDAKTQYVAACNTLETLLIHEDVYDEVLSLLKTYKNIELRYPTREADYKEYLDYILTVKKVSSLEEAIDHINRYGSHHTDCIISQDMDATERFMSLVDSAGVYSNCSTRFADGFRYGFGAEVGISTGKLHARGPVGLDGLVTYKYKLRGDGQIVSDYARGEKSFHYKDR